MRCRGHVLEKAQLPPSGYASLYHNHKNRRTACTPEVNGTPPQVQIVPKCTLYITYDFVISDVSSCRLTPTCRTNLFHLTGRSYQTTRRHIPEYGSIPRSLRSYVQTGHVLLTECIWELFVLQDSSAAVDRRSGALGERPQGPPLTETVTC
jgi:hypothetical protein